MICGDTPNYGWMGGSMGGSGQIAKNRINIDLFEIIQFYLKIYDFLRHPIYGWVYGLLGEFVG